MVGNFKKNWFVLSLLAVMLTAGGVLAQAPVPDAGWTPYIIRGATTGGALPVIQDNDDFVTDAIEFIIALGGQKAGLGTDLLNGARVDQITALHIDRHDDVVASGALWGPYFNIWVTDGVHYAVIANEPSNPEWGADRWDVTSWAGLANKTCKVYETPDAAAGTSWVHTYALTQGWSGVLAELDFQHVAGLIIAPPPVDYIENTANAVGGGAPDELGTNVAYGYTWVFGDTMDNYVSPEHPGYIVDNYYVTATLDVFNVTQVTSYATIGAALAAAVDGDEIVVGDGTYNETLSIPVGVNLHSANGAAVTTIAGSGGGVVTINADGVEISGFTITNPTGTYAITSNDNSGIYIHDNVITGIGSSSVSSYVHALAIICSAQPVDDVVIEDNVFSNIEAGEYSSASAISVGWSNGSEDVTNLVIEGNDISHVRSNTSPWNVGHGAYGILLNHAGGTALGRTVGAQILNNTIDDLEGLWAHGIGLEGNTPGALVSGNTISNLVDHKDPSDAIAIMVEANASAGTVTLTGNTFSNVNVGVASVVLGAGIVNAAGNTWGDPSGPYSPYANPNGTGAAVFGQVAFVPWVGRTATLVADLGIDPAGKMMAVDGYGFWEGTPAVGVADDFATGFAPGSLQANVTAADAQKYTKYGFFPEMVFGRPVHVGELYSISYFTQKGTTHVSPDPVGDWFCQMYTNGTEHGWYGDRINAEPYFAENLNETPGAWTKWVSDEGSDNRLRFFDSNLSLGSYTDGFLQDMAVSPDYGTQTIMLFGLGTGTPWAEGFDGKLDGLTVELMSGEKATFNFITGEAVVTAAPSATGPIACGETVTVTFSLTTDAYTPDVFLYNAVVRFTDALTTTADLAHVHDLLPFTSNSNQFQVSDQGDGSFIIAGSTVGSPSYPITEPGTHGLFSIDFTTAPDGLGEITFDSFTLRDPANAPIASSASGATILVDCTDPAAVTGVTCAPHHNRVEINWTHPGTDVDHFAVYRGLAYDTNPTATAYPEYNDLLGYTVPTDLGYAGWEAAGTVAVGTSTFEDSGMTTGRGIYFYKVVAVDAVGNESPESNLDAATNYWLGDVSGDGFVNITGDMGFLGDSFGTTDGGSLPDDGNYNNLCDVGPTDDWSRTGIPTTDSKVNFEDLMIFSMNFGVVTDLNKTQVTVASAAHLEWVTFDETHFGLRLIDGQGLKGVRVTASLPEGVIGDVTAGDLMDQQSEMTFLKNVGASLDVNLAVMGTGNGFTGSGDLFVVESSQPIAMQDISIQLRGADNSEIEVSLDASSDTLTPRVFALNANYPNPFNPMTKISFSLPEAQNVSLVVYSLDGRKVATLVNETRQAGLHEVVWTGRNDAGHGVASGTYFYRINAGPYSSVHKMTLMK